MRISFAAALAAVLLIGCAKASIPISAEPRDDGGRLCSTALKPFSRNARTISPLSNS